MQSELSDEADRDDACPATLSASVRRSAEPFIPLGEATRAVVLTLSSRFPRIKVGGDPGREEVDPDRL